MKLSETTLSILKNFSAVNSGVVLRKGNVQKTISADKSTLVIAKIDEDIQDTFGIYDLNQFLGNVTTLKNPELTFTDKEVTMDDGEMTLTFYSCSSNLIISPPDKELNLKSVDVKFTLTNATLQKILKVAAMNSLSHITVIGKDGALLLQAHEKNNDTSNYARQRIGDYAGTDFEETFKAEKLKLMPGDYDVEMQSGAFAKFANQNGDLTYFIAMESK